MIRPNGLGTAPGTAEAAGEWMRRLEGAVTLVTGAGRGLGEMICEELANAGAVVIAADIRDELAEAVSSRLRESGHSAHALHLDVTDERAVERAVQAIVHQYGKFDILINNAATDVTVPVDELSVEQWDRVLGTNLRGPFLLSRQAFSVMKGQGGGQIVNIVSTASKRTWPNASAYHASKWGLMGLSHALHAEGRPFGIKVSAIVAGGMRTPFLLDRFPDINVENLQDPRNVARVVRFVLVQPDETVIPEVMVIPMKETSWP